MSTIDLVVPDIGNFAAVPVVDVLVKVGDSVELETPLITLETDKATMDVPSAAAGTVTELLVKKGDTVGKGTVIGRVQAQGADAGAGEPKVAATAPAAPPPPAAPAAASGDTVRMPVPSAPRQVEGPADRSAQVVVLGSGPGGYTAAFRAADLGLKVTLVERWETLGGVCLNVGCIPSKTLLHAAKVVDEAESMAAHGISFGKPAFDLAKLRGFKDSVVKKLTGGLAMLAKQRKVEVVAGTGRFLSPQVLEVTGPKGSERIRFEHCIIAAGSEAVKLPGWPTDPRIIDSTGALELPAMGTRVSVVELTAQLMPGCAPDLVKPLEKRLRARYEQILLGTKVTGVETTPEGIRVSFAGDKAPEPQLYDYVLVAVGRSPNGKLIGAEAAGVKVSDRGFIPVDKQMRTNVPHIFAIGDIVGQPMLAHKATHEAKVAAEVIAGHKAAFDARAIPSVAYTDPEIAWIGLTETEAKAKGIAFEKALFPWAASGRSLSLGRDEGFTKLLFDPVTHRVLGGGIVGSSAGDLISEVALAIEMGADATDISLTVHPHPTLSETVAFAAEAFDGTLTDLYLPRKK